MAEPKTNQPGVPPEVQPQVPRDPRHPNVDPNSPEGKLRRAGFRDQGLNPTAKKGKGDTAYGVLFTRPDYQGRAVDFWLNEDTEDTVDDFLAALAPQSEAKSED